MRKYRTLKNKLYAIAMIIVGLLPLMISNDISVLVFMTFIAIPMFFTKEDIFR